MLRVSRFSSINFDEDWKLPFQIQPCYIQKFMPGDIPCVQFFCSLNSTAKVRVKSDVKTIEIDLDVLMQDEEKKCMEALIDLSWVTDYTVAVVEVEENGEVVHTATIAIDPDMEDSVLVECTNNRNDFDTVFDTGSSFPFRVEGCFLPSEYSFDSDTELFRDQRHVNRLLSSVPIEKRTLTIGGGFGVPNWAARKLNLMFCCAKTWVNGEKYVRTGGVEMTQLHVDYPLFLYKIEVERSEDEVTVNLLQENEKLILQQNTKTILLEKDSLW